MHQSIESPVGGGGGWRRARSGLSRLVHQNAVPQGQGTSIISRATIGWAQGGNSEYPQNSPYKYPMYSVIVYG